MTSVRLATRSVVPPIASPADECSAHVKVADDHPTAYGLRPSGSVGNTPTVGWLGGRDGRRRRARGWPPRHRPGSGPPGEPGRLSLLRCSIRSYERPFARPLRPSPFSTILQWNDLRLVGRRRLNWLRVW